MAGVIDLAVMAPASGPQTSGALEPDGEAGGAAEQAAGNTEVDRARRRAEHDAADVAEEGSDDGIAGVDETAIDGLATPAGRVSNRRHAVVE